SASGEGRQGSTKATFKSIIKTDAADIPAVDAKPEYHTVLATVAQIDPDINLYYNACPENNRKVVEQNGMWLCEYDGKTYPSMVRRYIPLIKCTDHTSECTVNLFNDTAEQLLGMPADDLAPLKETEGQAEFKEVLRRAQWTQWTMRIRTQSREYNNEVRQRCSVQSMQPVDFSTESRWLLQQIESMSAA
ncbi:hypothetical protein WJX84_007818, partial [Apatococcus fuscideae]